MSVRIYDENFSDLATITASSEQTAFPLTNAFNAQRRSKVWRTNGYWQVTSSNNSIVFNEGGSDLTATIAAADYTSSTSFFAAIKTALEDVGAGTYTVSADATNLKIVISKTSGGTFSILWSDAGSTAADLLGYDDTSDDTGWLEYTADELKINTSEWVQWDFGVSSNPSAFALIGSRNQSIQISPSASITLYGNETNNWSSPSATLSLAYDDNAIYSSNPDGLWGDGNAYRYARLEIIDPSNANGFVQVGALFLGDMFNPTRGRVQFPFSGQYVDLSTTSFSEGGQSFSDVRPKSEVFTISWLGLTVSEKVELDALFQSFGTSRPFFVEFDSTASFFQTANDSVRYVKFQNSPSYQLVSPGNFSCSMTLREEL